MRRAMRLNDAILDGEPTSWPEGWPVPTTGMRLFEVVALVTAAAPETSETQVLKQILERERSGHLSLRFASNPSPLADVESAFAALDEAVRNAPALHGLSGYELDRRRFPALVEWFGSGSSVDHFKRFERSLYLRHLEPHLADLAPGAAVLDMGCGSGRMATCLAARGFALTLVDASSHALKRATAGVLAAAPRARPPAAWLADGNDLDFLESGSFALTLAIEVLCYQANPALMLAELVRVTRPGGLVVVSVEGLYGGLLQDRRLGLGEAESVLAGQPLVRPHDLFVTYFTRESLAAALEAQGLVCLNLEGTHYVTDGPLAQLAEGLDFADEVTCRRVLDLEQRCAADPVLSPLARAWLAVARVPQAQP